MYRVSGNTIGFEVWENEKCCGNTIRRRGLPQLFRVLQTFTSVSIKQLDYELEISIT